MEAGTSSGCVKRGLTRRSSASCDLSSQTLSPNLIIGPGTAGVTVAPESASAAASSVPSGLILTGRALGTGSSSVSVSGRHPEGVCDCSTSTSVAGDSASASASAPASARHPEGVCRFSASASASASASVLGGWSADVYSVGCRQSCLLQASASAQQKRG